MAWIDSLKQRLPTIPEETVTVGLIVGGAASAVVLACLFPVAAAIGGAVIIAAAASSSVVSNRNSRKSVAQAGRSETAVTRAGGYFCMEQEQETESRRFQEMVSSSDRYQGWDR